MEKLKLLDPPVTKGVSISIVFHNEGANIIRCLSAVVPSLLKFRLTSEIPVEFLFINNCSDLNCTFYIEEFCQTNNLQYQIISTDVNNMGRARNKALLAASYDALIFLDADCCPQGADWLLNYLNLFEQLDSAAFAAVGGENIPPHISDNVFYTCCRLLKRNPLLYLGSTQLLPASHLKKVSHMPTCNILYKTSSLKAVGGFNEDFSRAGEDLEMNMRLRIHGFDIYMAPNIEVEHYDKTNFIVWFKKVSKYGSAQPHIILMHPRHVGIVRWLPLLAVFMLGSMILIYPKASTLVLLALAMLVPISTWSLSPQWFNFFPWIVFLNGTVASYLYGYTLGIGRIILKALKRQSVATPMAAEKIDG